MIVVGAISLIVGAVWIFQGLNVIPGSFMTGSPTWLGIGLILALFGFVLVVLGIRGSAGRRSRP